MLAVWLLTRNAKSAAKTQIRAGGKSTPDLFGTVQWEPPGIRCNILAAQSVACVRGHKQTVRPTPY